MNGVVMNKVKVLAALLAIGLLFACESNVFKRGSDDNEVVSTKTLPDGTIQTTTQKPVAVNGTNVTVTTVITTQPNGTSQTNVTYTADSSGSVSASGGVLSCSDSGGPTGVEILSVTTETNGTGLGALASSNLWALTGGSTGGSMVISNQYTNGVDIVTLHGGSFTNTLQGVGSSTNGGELILSGP